MMYQIPKQTDEDKMVMYMKLSKKKLVEMLIECNKLLDLLKPEVDNLHLID